MDEQTGKIPCNQVYNRVELNKMLDYMESYYTMYEEYKKAKKLDDSDTCYRAYLEYKDKVCKVLFRPYMISTDRNLAMKRDKFKYYFDENDPNYIDPDKVGIDKL